MFIYYNGVSKENFMFWKAIGKILRILVLKSEKPSPSVLLIGNVSEKDTLITSCYL